MAQDAAQAKTIPLSRHPFADGSYKKMLIDGKVGGGRFWQTF
jgi:hypothetical protein